MATQQLTPVVFQRISWTEGPSKLQPKGSQGVGRHSSVLARTQALSVDTLTHWVWVRSRGSAFLVIFQLVLRITGLAESTENNMKTRIMV